MALFVIQYSDFFAEYRTVAEIEEAGFQIENRNSLGQKLKRAGFKCQKVKGQAGKYLLAGLEPWRDSLPQIRCEIEKPTDNPEPYLECYRSVIDSHTDEIIDNNYVVQKSQLAEWLDSTVDDLDNDEDFDNFMSKLQIKDLGDTIQLNVHPIFKTAIQTGNINSLLCLNSQDLQKLEADFGSNLQQSKLIVSQLLTQSLNLAADPQQLRKLMDDSAHADPKPKSDSNPAANQPAPNINQTVNSNVVTSDVVSDKSVDKTCNQNKKSETPPIRRSGPYGMRPKPYDDLDPVPYWPNSYPNAS